jgi:excisionase family DNA binding protein
MREYNRTISSKQAAAMLNISLKALKMRARRGTLPSHRVGIRLRFKLSDIVAIIDTEWNQESGLNRLLSRPQAAQMLNMTAITLWDRTRRGIKPLPVGSISGRYFYRIADIVDAIDNPVKEGEFERPLSPPVKHFLGRKGDPVYGIKYETITAKCPYCRDTFQAEVVKGSSKWIYCAKHAHLRYANGADALPVNLVSMSY